MSNASNTQIKAPDGSIARPENSEKNAPMPVIEIVKHYHDLSKHSFYAYAPGPETLDWDNQPNPFRSFEDTKIIDLPLGITGSSQKIQNYYELLAASPASQTVDLHSISALLRYALGLSAWKQYGPDRWSLRVNPSSGNLHPTEAYLLFTESYDNVPSGLYHYNVQYHRLEKRADVNRNSALLPSESFVIGLTSVLWRELWKYGERGFRYTQLDTGHAISSLAFSARALGWQVSVLKGVYRDEMAQILGLDRSEYNSVEKEIAECLLHISTKQITSIGRNLPSLKNWSGVPTRLGERSFYRWPWAEKVAMATDLVAEKTASRRHVLESCEVLSFCHTTEQHAFPKRTEQKVAIEKEYKESKNNSVKQESGEDLRATPSFQQLALRRRSAQAFDKSSITQPQFTQLLQSLLNFSQPIFASGPAIDFVVMVHRVESIQPGLYVMPADINQKNRLEKACNKWQSWERVLSLSETALYQLKVANVQKAAKTLCCQQAIAADGACTIGFLSYVESSLTQYGALAYRQLYWQAGMLSQQLYLQAAALNLAATGIGCFYDEPWAGMLAEKNSSLQMLYLTAVGAPILDERISNFSGYHHLTQAQAPIAEN